jgi:uncharacterized protein YndB with AHSA1/START domain
MVIQVLSGEGKRMLKSTLMAAALLLVSGVANAQPARSWKDFPGVSNTSYVDAAGDKALQLSMDIPAPPRAVFEAFATTDGFKSWAVPVARIDLRTGGEIESSYNPNAKIGDPANIKNRILTFVPDRLLVIQNIQAPTDFAGAGVFQKTATIVEFEPLEAGAKTRVRITNTGYGASPEAQTVFGHFEWGNAYTLTELKKHFEKGAQ